jgi:hypothetical protein
MGSTTHCSHFKTQSCSHLGSAFEVAAFLTPSLSPTDQA